MYELCILDNLNTILPIPLSYNLYIGEIPAESSSVRKYNASTDRELKINE